MTRLLPERKYWTGIFVILLLTTSCYRLPRISNAGEGRDSSISIADDSLQTDLLKEKGKMISQPNRDYVFKHTEPTIIYVDPDGSGDGSSEISPVKLEHALLSGNVIAGDTILLLDGVYKGNYTSTITGSPERQIIIKAKNAYRAIIDGGLQIGDLSNVRGAYTIVRNLRIYYSDTIRGKWIDPQGSNQRPAGILNAAPYCKFINNIIHDGGVGIGSWQKSDYSEIYGNIIFNSGAPDNLLGFAQNIYFQGTGKIIRHNVFAGGFKRTFAGFGTKAFIKNCSVLANVIFARGSALVGSIHNECDKIIFNDNHIIADGNTMQIGYNYKYNGKCVIKGNRMYGKSYFAVQWWNDVEMSNNVFVQGEKVRNTGFQFYDDRNPKYFIWNFHNNDYHYLGPAPLLAFADGVSWFSWDQWNAAGYDIVGSTFTTSKPNTNEYFVYANEYPAPDDPRMGIVVIWNWEGLENVKVDLSDLGLEVSRAYQWRQAQDPLGDIDTWVCKEEAYSFPMTGHTVAKPIGFNEELVPSQFPTFGCFIIERL